MTCILKRETKMKKKQKKFHIFKKLQYNKNVKQNQ